MNAIAKLTMRENEVAELFAWGAAKKEVASLLNVSERTVENHARSIYEKTGCGKVNELSAWWFCTHFNISFDLSPLRRTAIATAMTIMMIFASCSMRFELRLPRQRLAVVSVRVCRGRMREEDFSCIM